MSRHDDFGDLDDFFGRPTPSGRVSTLPPPVSDPPRTTPAGRSARQGRPPSRGAAPRARAVPTGPSRPVRPAPVTRAPRPARQVAPAPRPARPRRVPALIDGSGEEARRRTRRRLIALIAVIAVLMTAIAARLTDLQVVSRSRYVAYGLGQREGHRIIPAGRGAIFDRAGRAFALSVPRSTVVADPSQVTRPAAAAARLAPILGLEVAVVQRQLEASNRYQVLARTVSDRVAARVAKLKLPGITLENDFVRENPAGDLARAVVGTVVAGGATTKEGRSGISGIEQADDRLLTGTPGTQYFERDPGGNTIAGGHQRLDPAVPGGNLYLTLDQSLQYETEAALTQQVKATGAGSAMAVIQRPSTGEILAMASVGTDSSGKVGNTRDNKPVTATFEPGSVNKMVTIAGALEEGLVRPDTTFVVPDHLQVADHTFTDHDPHPTAPWSITDILVNSSNVGTIKVAQRLGKSGVDRYLRSFGFGAGTGLGFPNEASGIMRPLENWSGTSIGSIPIGQGIAVTALQLLSAYNVIANDGVYVAPKLVAAIDRGNGRVATEPSGRRRVVSTRTARALQEMLKQVVTDGTGKKAAVPGYEAAGKTGTARIPQQGADATDGYRDAQGRYHYQSTFIGFVAGTDLSIVVTVADAKTSIFGGDIGAPVFSRLASVALRRFQIPPPALATNNTVAVPQLSASARQIGGEDPLGPGRPAAG